MQRKIGFATAIFLLVVQAAGCTSDKLVGTHVSNEPPKVWLTIGPPEGSVTSYRVHVYWSGWDSDGDVEYYEWALTDNETGVFDPADTTGADKWHRISRTDSVFLVTADVRADSSGGGAKDPVEFRRAHTFFVRAVDDDGTSSLQPAYGSFTATTLSPELFITTPQKTGLNSAIMPSVITFKWIARDVDSEGVDPDSVRWILLNNEQFGQDWNTVVDYIRKNPNAPEWSEWHYYNAPGDSGKSWTTDPPLDFGFYTFAAQAKDAAGAVTAVFDLDKNVRRVFVDENIITGPVVSVSYKYMKRFASASASTAPVILTLPAGLPVGFSWTADASDYGGTIMGYRYAWDIIDLSDPEQWEISLTPFVGTRAVSPTRKFFFGTHTFLLEVVDNNGLKTRITVVVNIVPFTLERSLLIVDDWKEESSGFRLTGGLTPSDQEHDQFWVDMGSQVAGFTRADIFHVEGGQNTVPIEILAKYKAVVWNAKGSAFGATGSALTNLVKFYPPGFANDNIEIEPNLLEMYMQIGGKVLLVGENIMATTINRAFFWSTNYPLIYRYELTGSQGGVYPDSEVGVRGIGDESFAYKDCCLNVIDIALIASLSGFRRHPTPCAVHNFRGRSKKTEGLRECIPIDETYVFPRLTLRPEVSAIGKWYHESRAGLNTDVYNPPYFESICNDLAEIFPPRDCFQPMYGLECLNTSSRLFGAPIAYWAGTHKNRVPVGDGVPARSAVWGFEPVYFNPNQVKEALSIIFFDEWKLPRH